MTSERPNRQVETKSNVLIGKNRERARARERERVKVSKAVPNSFGVRSGAVRRAE